MNRSNPAQSCVLTASLRDLEGLSLPKTGRAWAAEWP